MIIITSTFTADVMHPSLQLLLKKFCDQESQFIYNQLLQQAILPTSEFNKNDVGLNVMLIRMSDWFNLHHTEEVTQQRQGELLLALNTLHKSMKVPLLILITPSLSATEEEEKYLLDLEDEFKSETQLFKNTLFLTSKEITQQCSTSLIFDSFAEKYAHIPYTLEFYNDLSYIVARKYSLLTRKPHKVIVADCDGTLWKGIVEEDGLDGLIIDHNFAQFQQFIIECYENGFLICLCSKNSKSSVLSVFEKHQNMLLNIEKHICTSRINWELKSTNIKSIAKELNLSLDSFIFLDDNEAECAEVKAQIPEALVIKLHKDIQERMPYLKNVWAFDYLKNGKEDTNRTKFYQTNQLRSKLKSESLSYSQYLENLHINVSIQKATLKDYDRINELSQRTNQFNLFPNIMTSVELSNCITSNYPHCLSIQVTDKFGDYGLVGVIIYEIEKAILVIKNFFLSCRILGRGIEYQLIEKIGEIAKQNKASQIKILFKVSEKNIPAMNFIKQISGLKDIKNEGYITIETEQTESISTKYIQSESSAPNPVIMQKDTNIISSDFMLDIANKFIKKRTKSKVFLADNIYAIKINLLELFRRHKIPIRNTDKSFIELGLDSLKSVLISSEIHQIYHVNINPFELLQADLTLDKFINYLARKIKNSTDSFKDFIFKSDVIIPLSNAQKRLWYDEKLSTGSSKNNIFIAYEVYNIDLDILQKSFIKIIERHDALRFSFYEENNEPYIKLNHSSKINFQIKKFTNLSPSDLAETIDDFKHTPFNLYELPLFRMALINFDSGKQILLFSIHHIIHDGWSLHILLDELSSIYNGNANGFTPFFQETFSYTKFIYWHKQYLSRELLSIQKKFWKKQLDHLQKLELIYDNPRLDNAELQPAKRINFKIDESTTRKLKQISLMHHVTLYDVLITAFGLLLSHYTNQTDINFMTAVSGRHYPQVGRVIGFFINLLIVRFQITNELNFVDLLKNNKKILNEVFAHQDLSFNEILHSTGETVTSKINSFNQAGFIFQNYPRSPFKLNDQAAKRVYSDDNADLIYDSCQECRFGNLVFFMQESGSNLHGLVEYNSYLFHEKTIYSMISSFTTLLKNITKQIDCSAMSIPLLTLNQKNALLKKGNIPVKDYPTSVSLLTYFSNHVISHPNKIAVKYQNEFITYSELDKKSTILAHRLIQVGIIQETPVGILLEKSIEQIIAILGILKAGGCYVPLEKDIPSARIKYIIEDSKLSCLLTDNNLMTFVKEQLPPGLQVLTVSPYNQDIPSDFITCESSPHNLAYILYTSGSTGTPKGVMIEQAGILRLVIDSNYITINTTDCIAQTSSFLFDAATLEIWGALLNGATLVLIDKPTLLETETLANVLTTEKVSILFLTTQLFHSYVYSSPYIFEHLKYLVVGGEVVLAEAVNNLFSQSRHPTYFINGYGPTENTTFSTTYLVKHKMDIKYPIPIGKPITGTKVFILDKNYNPAPIGAPGKLYVGGLGVARKYLNKESLNHEKFIEFFQKRLYDTGDIVLWQADGNIKYIGREDDQIKVNGYRIELKEIEVQLKHHHFVEQAVVLIKNSKPVSQLAAYILLKDNRKLSDINLHQHLKTSLPKYMLPTFYYQISHIPITQNGKVDNRVLSQLQIEPTDYSQFESPTTPLQEEVIALYANILGISSERIGVNSDFFDLGGNSISALTLIHLINKQFHVNINFSILYAHSNVKSLSEQLNYLLNEVQFSIPFDKDHLGEYSIKTIKVGAKNKTPIIFVHPIGGTGFCYLNLIKLLPPEQPCYILQDPSIEANQILFDDMASMATYYNHLLLNKFKTNKLILAGYSFGGMLSLEMVAQLEEVKLAGCVECIISFDTWVVSNLLDVEAKADLKKSIMEQYVRVANNLTQENIDPQPWMKLYYHRLQELGFAYTPPFINKKIILFKAKEQSKEFLAMNDPTNYLKRHTAGPVEVYLISGNHDSILEPPHVQQISHVLKLYFMDKVYEEA